MFLKSEVNLQLKFEKRTLDINWFRLNVPFLIESI